MNKFLLIALFVFALVMCTTREKFVEVFGFAGYAKPATVDYDSSLAPIKEEEYVEQQKFEITPDIVSDIVNVIQKHVRDKQNLCVQPVETNFVNKLVNTTDETKVLYRARMMFMVPSGFPFGVAISADVLMAPTPTLVRIQTQPSQVDESVMPYQVAIASDFVQWNEVLDVNKPRLTGIKSEEKLLGKVVDNGSPKDSSNPGE